MEARRPGACSRTTRHGAALWPAPLLDLAWMDEVDAGDGVLISTQGLLMYLQPPEVESLIRKLRMPIVEVPFAG